MTSKEKQKWLDKRKWLMSEKMQADLSGEMKYCTNCEFCTIDSLIPLNHRCCKSQDEREEYSLCAKAYRRQYE